MKDLTLTLALEQTIEVWSYLAEHTEIKDKVEILDRFNYLRHYLCRCPLCEFHRTTNPDIETNYDCSNCPLKCDEDSSPYRIWDAAWSSDETRQEAARTIVSLARTALEEHLKTVNKD